MENIINSVKKQFEEEDNVKINIPVGTRDTADHFLG